MTTAVPRPSVAGAQRETGHRNERLHRLLEHGPFPDALRAAIEASGLSLDRIQYRLHRRGVRVSVATLSYWQSGRRRPERPTSLAALGHLEAALELDPGSLSALLGPPRPRGRRGTEGLPALESFWTPRPGAQALLSGIDTSTNLQLRCLSHYDRATVGANRRMQSLFCRQVMRAETDGPDRWILVHDWADAGGSAQPIVTHVRNCSVGSVYTSQDATVCCVELNFERPLRRGETLLFEYELWNPAAELAATEPSDCLGGKFPAPCREYLLELMFDPAVLPARCQQYSLAANDETRHTRNIPINTSGSAHTIAMDLGAGEFGVRWDW